MRGKSIKISKKSKVYNSFKEFGEDINPEKELKSLL